MCARLAKCAEKHIDGASASRSITLRNACGNSPPTGRCSFTVAGGYRSSIAASLLRQRGFGRVGELAGGVTAWEAAASLPLESDLGSALISLPLLQTDSQTA